MSHRSRSQSETRVVRLHRTPTLRSRRKTTQSFVQTRRMGEIAFLGWGSLCWNPGSLPIAGEWRSGGPTLPLEFSRISSNGRLTLVIDPSGASCETRFAWSAANMLATSIEALRVREGPTRLEWIGYRNGMGGGSSIDRFPDQLNIDDLIAAWLVNQRHGASSAVWTALPPNFFDRTEQQFSVENAMAYMRSLDGETLVTALEYITKAPSEVQTPFRAAATAEWNLPV